MDPRSISPKAECGAAAHAGAQAAGDVIFTAADSRKEVSSVIAMNPQQRRGEAIQPVRPCPLSGQRSEYSLADRILEIST
jgi:hypothetical protein